MADQICYNNQANQSQLNGIILCKNHNKKCNSFTLEYQDQTNIFNCTNCSIQQSQICQNLVSLSDICNYDENSVILSWPPLENQALLQEILFISQQNNKEVSESSKISIFFDELEQQIVQKLQQQKKKILLFTDNILSNSSKVLEYYQSITSIQTLKDIIQDQKLSSLQKSVKVKQIIDEKKQESIKNTEVIRQLLSENKTFQIFNEQIYQDYKESILQQIELIDYNNNHIMQDAVNYNKSFKQFYQGEQEEEEINLEEGNLSTIIKLISNKTNQCNQAYLDSVRIQLLKVQGMINKLQIEKQVFQPDKQQLNLDLSDLNQEQIDSIQDLSNKLRELNAQYKLENNDSQFISQKIQPSSQFIMDSIFKLDQLITKEKISKIEKLFRKYPIFEIEQIIKPTQIQYQIEFSDLNNSKQNGKISFDDEGNYKLESISDSYSVFLIQIKKDSQYQVRIKLNLFQNNKYFFIGLIKNSDKNSTYISNNGKLNSFTPDNYYGDRGVSNVTKGKCLREVKYPDEYQEIEINFCVQKKLFQVCDYPKKENINEINKDKLDLIDLGQEYYLGIQLYYKQDFITVTSFQELQIEN